MPDNTNVVRVGHSAAQREQLNEEKIVSEDITLKSIGRRRFLQFGLLAAASPAFLAACGSDKSSSGATTANSAAPAAGGSATTAATSATTAATSATSGGSATTAAASASTGGGLSAADLATLVTAATK